MVVHSGQASGGHYYSYIKHGDRWYKIDDGDVTEVNMEDDEELKTQLCHRCWLQPRLTIFDEWSHTEAK